MNLKLFHMYCCVVSILSPLVIWYTCSSLVLIWYWQRGGWLLIVRHCQSCCVYFYIDVSLMKVDCCVFLLLTRNLDIVACTNPKPFYPCCTPMILLTSIYCYVVLWLIVDSSSHPKPKPVAVILLPSYFPFHLQPYVMIVDIYWTPPLGCKLLCVLPCY